MILRVGAFLYRVRFVEGYIMHEGERCLGLCDNDAHEIQVSTLTSFAQQVQVVCHEYMEAWLYHFGQDMRDKEAYCDLFGMAMTQFVLDLTHQIHLFAQMVEGKMDSAGTPGGAAADPVDVRTGRVGESDGDTSDSRGGVGSGRVDDRGAGSRGGAGRSAFASRAGHSAGDTAGPERAEEPADTGAFEDRQAIAAKLAAAVARVGLRAAKVHAGSSVAGRTSRPSTSAAPGGPVRVA